MRGRCFWIWLNMSDEENIERILFNLRMRKKKYLHWISLIYGLYNNYWYFYQKMFTFCFPKILTHFDIHLVASSKSHRISITNVQQKEMEKFTGKYLRVVHFLSRLAGLVLQLYLKKRHCKKKSFFFREFFNKTFSGKEAFAFIICITCCESLGNLGNLEGSITQCFLK